MGTPIAEPLFERRESRRAAGVGALVTVVARGDRRGAFQMLDLSASGALLVGDQPLARGDHIEIVCAIADEAEILHGEVVRIEAVTDARYCVAVVFRELPAPTCTWLRRFVDAAIERRRASAAPAILLVIEQPGVHRALQHDLSALKWRSVSGPTPSAIVRRLDDPALRVVAAIVDARHTNVREILSYLANEHETVRRIVLVDPRTHDWFETEIATGRIHALLVTSWERTALIAAVGLGDHR